MKGAPLNPFHGDGRTSALDKMAWRAKHDEVTEKRLDEPSRPGATENDESEESKNL